MPAYEPYPFGFAIRGGSGRFPSARVRRLSSSDGSLRHSFGFLSRNFRKEFACASVRVSNGLAAYVANRVPMLAGGKQHPGMEVRNDATLFARSR
jgi:hypothetical protein